MNILFVHQAFGSHGGAESNLYATAAELQARGHHVSLLTRRGTGQGEAAWRELFAGRFHLLADGAASPLAGVDLLYVHKWDDLPSLERLLSSPAPLVRMVHDHDLYCLRSYRYHPLTRRPCTKPAGAQCIVPCLAPLQRQRGGILPFRWASLSDKRAEIALSRRFDRNIVATEYMRGELLLNGFPAGGIAIIPPVPRPAEPLESTFSDRNLVLFAGQLIRGKGVDVLLQSLARVKVRFEAAIVGDGHYRAACERLARKLGVQDRVRFTGFVAQPELQQFYRDTSVVAVPSVWPEPMGLVGLEAMRYALPVVGFDSGGISAWLRDGDNGFLVPWMDRDALAGRIAQLLTDKALGRTMGLRGRERAARDFDFEQYISRLETLFDEVLSEKRTLCAA